ncbi:MFS transporter [Massilia sp. TS11]|uniref:MFS transporter n=1 Tax=Massilia sp. TS11 TaxID=2908003 RepID=UPI001EDA24AD|nr:MFS transporter [Massilia sp. TS11]MCG2584628.1 MFS transporter [Massilia sp. TS11]
MAPVQRARYSGFLFVYYAHAGVFTTFASLLFAARGMSAPQVGILMSLIPVMRIVGPNVWGWVADRSGQRLTVLRATAIAALVAFATIFVADSFPALFWAMLFLNLFTSAQTPLGEALMLTEMRGDVARYGKVRLWGSAGFIAAVLGFGYVLELYGIHLLPWLAGAMLVLTVLATFTIRAVAPLPHTSAPLPLGQVLRKREVQAFFISTGLAVAAHMSLYAYYSLFLEVHGYSKTVIGMMWSLGVLCEIVFFNFQAPVFGRFGAARVMQAALLVGCLRFALIGAAAEFSAVLVAMQCLHALTFAAHHSASIVTLQRWFSGPLLARGQALFISLAYGVGGSIGGLAMAAAWKQFGPSSVYYLAALFALGAWWWARRATAPHPV